MALKIGLTGGIGSGKTTAAKVFSTLGIPVFDADSAARDVMNENETLRKNIIAAFGEESYTNNILNRKYIAGIVFNDPGKLEQLNAMVHPATIAMADEWFAKQTGAYVIKEAALMFESGAAAGLDYIIGVTAPQHIRIQRVMHRDKITRDEVLARMDKQLDESMKMKLCDFVLINDEQELLIPQVVALHEKLLTLKKPA
ncbi:MAG TPA: dephospho-CoA kinase [Panacibacter sp.]|nr:dephospho-CoA kinase [Panacibacter sp.]